jgi:hypothetical protein
MPVVGESSLSSPSIRMSIPDVRWGWGWFRFLPDFLDPVCLTVD